jgi:hypothetical protein
MKNSTNIDVPKKYQHMIDEIYQDCDGYWIYTKYGYYLSYFDLDTHVVSEDTQQEILKHIRHIKPCVCKRCKGELN